MAIGAAFSGAYTTEKGHAPGAGAEREYRLVQGNAQGFARDGQGLAMTG